MLLVDHQIRKYSLENQMISPFSEAISGNEIVGYGVTSAGYDIRLGPEIFIFKNTHNEIIDPRKFNDPIYRARIFDKVVLEHGDPFVIPPHSYILGCSYEYFRIPRHLKARCVGKSTLARCGIIANLTPLEPEWDGYLTLEIKNAAPCPAIVRIMEGIAQIEFEMLAADVEVSYADKKGKYQSQIGVTPAKV